MIRNSGVKGPAKSVRKERDILPLGKIKMHFTGRGITTAVPKPGCCRPAREPDITMTCKGGAAEYFCRTRKTP